VPLFINSFDIPNKNGLPTEARAIIIPSAPCIDIACSASCGELISPFSINGIVMFSFIFGIWLQSASPVIFC
jgi:hypothetical protein